MSPFGTARLVREPSRLSAKDPKGLTLRITALQLFLTERALVRDGYKAGREERAVVKRTQRLSAAYIGRQRRSI